MGIIIEFLQGMGRFGGIVAIHILLGAGIWYIIGLLGSI